jgi:sulfite reductase (NADPH) flavoprotein alpha-component
MANAPFIPDNAPFTPEQRAWLNGFLAGMFSRTPATHSGPAPQALKPLTILFGSQTGTAESLAKKAAKEAGKRGFAATVLDMAQTSADKLASEKNLLVITSTYGDGEPPDNAKSLWTALGKADAPRLAGLRFSVCGLGDTNYAQFCKCGKDFDSYFERLGGTRAFTRVDCDLDYDAAFNTWLEGALGALNSDTTPATAPSITISAASSADAHGSESGFSRKNPFFAPLITSRKLNGEGSAKEVRHVEFALENSNLVYEAGDALGVYPHNCPEHVAELLALLGCDGEEAVPGADGQTTSLRHALTSVYDLGKPTAELVGAFSSRGVSGANTAVAVVPLHVIDLLAAFPGVKLAPAELVSLLKKIQPRLYSISSSPKAHPGQVHLTVGAVRYEANGRARKGLCSTYLADRAVPGETRVGIFVHSNKAFRPPADHNAPMIMVGPGTGIAPFRAFLEERRANGAKGKNWLFFGDQRAATDFLYRDELEAMRKEGTLSRLDTAFSRDQAEKIYVQNRMLENAAELYAWLESGAHFYVCGDASRMAKDVDHALHQVIQKAGNKTAEQAAAYVDHLKATKRYARDVY